MPTVFLMVAEVCACVCMCVCACVHVCMRACVCTYTPACLPTCLPVCLELSLMTRCIENVCFSQHQNKKPPKPPAHKMQCLEDMKSEDSWRMGTCVNLQVGQVIFYLIAVQLNNMKKKCSPNLSWVSSWKAMRCVCACVW